MKLNVGERLTLTGVIPKEGNFETMSTVEKLKKILYLSEEEVTAFGLEPGSPEIPVNEHTTKKIEIDISELGLSMIMRSLKKLDEEEKLNSFQFNVYKYLKEQEEESKKPKKE